MTRIFSIFGCLLFWCLIWMVSGQTVYANQTKTDGKITGTIFIDPNDQPIATIKSTLYVALDDRTGAFTPQDCTCIFVISHNNKEIDRITVQTTNNQTDSQVVIPYIFPEIGPYTITLLGSPKASATFAPFSLRYSYTVRTTAAQPTDGSATPIATPKPTLEPTTASFLKTVQGFKPIVSLIGYGVGILMLILGFLLARSVSRRMRRWH